MIIHLLETLNKQRHIILASGSPRRREILHGLLKLDVHIVESDFDESSLDKALFASAAEFVQENAKQKALAVMSKQTSDNFFIIAADSVVVKGKHILEKPTSDEHAKQMLSLLSNGQHLVYTGVALAYKDVNQVLQVETLVEQSLVTFDAIGEAEMDAYIKTGEHKDKAGGYGIQALGGTWVKAIQGCYYNIMGFPLHAFCKRVAQIQDKLLVKNV